MDVGETEVASAVVVGEALVVDAHEVEQRGVEVVEVDFVFGGVPTEVVSCPIDGASLHSATRETQGVAVGVVFSTVCSLTGWRTTKFAAPNDESIFEKSTGLQVGEEGAHRLVGGASIGAMSFFELSVLVPIEPISFAALDLNEADAAFRKTAGEEAAISKTLTMLVVETVKLAGSRTLSADVEGFRSSGLHAEGEFVGLGASGERIDVDAILFVGSIKSFQQFQLCQLFSGSETARVPQIRKRVVSGDVGGVLPIDTGTAGIGGKEARVVGAGPALLVWSHDDIARQVVVLRSETVEQPVANPRARKGHLTAERLKGRSGVIDAVAMHGSDDAELVGVLGHVREDLTDRDPRLAVLFEGERRGQDLVAAVAEMRWQLYWDLLPVVFCKERFGIEAIDLRDAPSHEEPNDPFGAGGKVEVCIRGHSLRFSGQQAAKRNHAESRTGLPEGFSPAQLRDIEDALTVSWFHHSM